MDIRKYLSKITESSSNSEMDPIIKKLKLDHTNKTEPIFSSSAGNPTNPRIELKLDDVTSEPIPSCSTTDNDLDLGQYIMSSANISDGMRYKFLEHPFKPGSDYNFKNDAVMETRYFKYDWLAEYNWLVYSKKLKGVLCKNCVVFRPVLRRGVMGSFIIKEFTKYKDCHAQAKAHMGSEWHRDSSIRAKEFLDRYSGKTKSVCEIIDSHMSSTIENNRKLLKPIISSMIFCATHDMVVRGKHSEGGNFKDLLKFRVESGDLGLSEHSLTCKKNAKYTSHQAQNELIEICGNIVRKNIVEVVNRSEGFSLLADESADISGKEQLSVGVKFVDALNNIKDEFTELLRMDAKTIAETILSTVDDYGLNLHKLMGLGFDGCLTMAGKENGVQKLIRDRYSKVTFFHCSSHRLNLVINDLNSVSEIRNCVGVIKEIINFFRDSPRRRSLVPNIPLFSETRWTAKYESIRLFFGHFVGIKSVLDDLTTNRDFNQAEQLSCSSSTPKFIICLNLISKYSAQLEPVTKILQGKSVNLLDVQKHLENLLQIFENNRKDGNECFGSIFTKSMEIANEFGIEIQQPRIAKRQINRTNIETASAEDYFRISLFIPYMDSLISSLKIRFSEDTRTAFSISC
ncbi:unnamed protein product [Phaedon cochleariae]|uniref:DUF4371 domain-containing protein n=1 Tax=Phaedon cochleariae TaxID=80249 RepID=A0A9N9SGB2_PHACE|nr:unnamed protein product [Phaedon cochleariae]